MESDLPFGVEYVAQLMAAKSNTYAKLALLGAASLLFGTACDKRKEEPQPVALPAPTPPPPAEPEPSAVVPASASAANYPPKPAEPPAVPPRVGVALGPPEGLVAGGWNAGGLCNIEAIGAPATGKPVVLKSGNHVSVSGWALDPKGTSTPAVVHVRLSSKAGDYYGTASKRTVRDDVNSSHPVQDKSAQSGFEMEFDTDQLPAGTYAVTTVMVFDDAAYICDNGRKVIRVP